jgi:hypothetical protein
MNRFVFLSIVFFVFNSCATEKVNTPTVTTAFANSDLSPESINSSINQSATINSNAAELTHLCTKFPKFKNEKMNAEVSVFKTHIQNYFYAMEARNENGMSRELRTIKQSYSKIQNYRKSLSKPEEEKINSLMVKIKRNIGALESEYSSPKK